ncbi:MAG: hypothetical protein ACR2OL_17020 [Anderseniella sp.]
MVTEDWAEIILAAALVSTAVLGVGTFLPSPDQKLLRAVLAAIIAGSAMFLLNLAFK